MDTAKMRAEFATDQTVGTHWGGCEYTHRRCAIRVLCDEVDRLRAGLIDTERDIQQILGKALGYPWFTDDPANWPDATEADGVAVGDHTAVTLAMEAAAEIESLRAEVVRLTLREDARS